MSHFIEYVPGTITFVRGPMFAGKTTYAIKCAHALEDQNKYVCYIRPERSRRAFEPHGFTSNHDGSLSFPVRDVAEFPGVDDLVHRRDHHQCQ